MTSDGIKDEDWDLVHEMACEIADAIIAEDQAMTKIWKDRLLAILDDLETRYGPLPSIMATRADYVEDSVLSQRLLEKAYARALDLSDTEQLELISLSLAELLIEERENRPLGYRWLAECEKYVRNSHDDFLLQRIHELKQHLKGL